MHVTASEVEYCKLHVVYRSDAATVEKHRQNGISELRKYTLPGFRAGKAPDRVIELKLKNQLNDFVNRKMHSQAFEDALFETKAKNIGQPTFSNVHLKGNEFSCEMIIPKRPDITLNYKELELDKIETGLNVDEQVGHMLNNLCTMYGNVAPYEDDQFVEMGDSVTMTLSYEKDGNVTKEEGILYTVGENRFPGLDKNMLGMKAGETRTFSLRDIPHTVEVHMGTKKTPCEITDELARNVGTESVDDLKEKLKLVVLNKVKDEEGKVYRNQVAEKLVKMHDFVVPDWLTILEAQYKAAQDSKQLASLTDDEKAVYMKSAEDSVRLSLVLDCIRDEEPTAMLTDHEAVNSLIKRAALTGKDPKKFLDHIQKTGIVTGLVAALRDEFTVQWVFEQAKVKEKSNV